jgi:O-antigen ligase
LGTESFIGARSFAVYALLGLGLLLGRWVHGSRISFWFALGLTLLIALSLSRTALVAGVLLFVLARVQSFSFRGLSRVAVASGIAACGLYFLVTSSDALSARFLGDSPVEEYLSGAASVDASGRLAFWAITVDSFGESPWLGKGPGTANDLIASEFEGMGHPHNEYLRFLHDGGVLALALLLGGCTQLLVLCRRGYSHGVRACSAGRAFYLGTFLAFLAVLFTMITDNTASYLFVMAPLGILIGTCLRSVKKLEQDMAVCAELSA